VRNLSTMDKGYSELIDGINHITKFSGVIYYVDPTNGNDGNDGKDPHNAVATITHAIDIASAGDAVQLLAGTYNEDVDINKNSMELWAEVGAVINAQAGAGLTVSGHYCIVLCKNGGDVIVNPVSNGTGLVASGNLGFIQNVRIPCASSGDIGFDVTGTGVVLTDCKAADPLIAAFKIQGDQVRLDYCLTGGKAADTSIGYWFTNSCDKPRMRSCSSQGHITAGYQVDTGVTNGLADNCVSGGGDGNRIDVDHAFVWAKYTYDNVIDTEITFAGADTTYNLFKVTGSVKVNNIYGLVETVIPNTSSSMHLSLYSTGGEVDITNNVGAPDIDTAPVGSLLIRIGNATDVLIYRSAATPTVAEATAKNPEDPVICTADYDQDTYIRINLTAALASGMMHWHCDWEPLGDNGWLEAA